MVKYTRGRRTALVLVAVGALGMGTAVVSPAAGSPATPVGLDTAAPIKKKCTPGYRPCLPPASDYDCRGGGGNGPKYTGRVIVTGWDIYGLDADNDGIGCE